MILHQLDEVVYSSLVASYSSRRHADKTRFEMWNVEHVFSRISLSDDLLSTEY